MSDRVAAATRVPAQEADPIGAPESAIVPAREHDPLETIALRGQRTIGTFTRNFSVIGAALTGAGLAPFVDGALAAASLAAATLGTIVAVITWARPWTLEIGLDGVRCWPMSRGAVVPWSFLREATLEPLDSATFGPEVTPSIRYVILWVCPAGGERWHLPAYASPDAALEAARDGICQRAAYARAFVEPDDVAKTRRERRSLAQWRQALEATRETPFRSTAIDLRSLRAAIESGALEPRAMVECAFALATLGSSPDRRWLARVARAVLHPVTRAAIEACAEDKLSDVAIERCTLG